MPFPDFTDCRFASREAAIDWIAVTHSGGPGARIRLDDAFLRGGVRRGTIEGVVEFMQDSARTEPGLAASSTFPCLW